VPFLLDTEVLAMTQPALEVLHTDHIYQGRIVSLDVEQVRLPNGRESTREIVRHPGAVVLVVVDDQERLLLVRQYRRAADRDLLELPAGTRERGEDAAITAARELGEETGYRAGRIERLGGFFSAPGFCTEYLECYLCTDLRPGELHPEEDEDLQLERLSLDEAWAAAAAGEINDAKTLAGLLLYAARHPEARPHA
jgi:ADP-ribose diphosphatase